MPSALIEDVTTLVIEEVGIMGKAKTAVTFQ